MRFYIHVSGAAVRSPRGNASARAPANEQIVFVLLVAARRSQPAEVFGCMRCGRSGAAPWIVVKLPNVRLFVCRALRRVVRCVCVCGVFVSARARLQRGYN